MLSDARTVTGAPPARAVPRTDRSALAERALRIARRTALGVLGDHAAADDVAQEVAIAVLRDVGQLRDPGAMDAWIHRIAARRAIKEARRSTTRRAAEIAGHRLHERTTLPDDPTARTQLDGALAALDGLPSRQRAALTLRYVHDLDDDAIAAALGCRPGTVRSLLSRGRDRLRATSAAPHHADADARDGAPDPPGASSRPTVPTDQEDPAC